MDEKESEFDSESERVTKLSSWLPLGVAAK